MTGPEHYRMAEHQLAAERSVNDPGGPLAAAQVHALLALAAAVALADPQSRVPAARPTGWAGDVGARFAGLAAEGR